MHIYIAGPMRGIKDYNFPAFDAARDHINAMGHIAISPADLDRERLKDTDMGDVVFEEVIPEDIAAVTLVADAVAVLPGWRHSYGACMEVLAALGCNPNKPILRVDDLSIVNICFADYGILSDVAEGTEDE